MNERRRAKRAIASIYSWAAERVYGPVVVRTFFPLLGGNIEAAVEGQARRAVEIAGGRPILDMPVGTAHFTLYAARMHHGLIVGGDIAEGMAREARRTAASAGVDNLVVVRADAHHLPFGDGSFGAVLCTNSLHVMPGLQATLSELRRVLRPDGRLFVSAITVPASRLVPRARASRLPTILLSSRHLAAAVAAAGFDVVDVTEQRLATLIEAAPRENPSG